MPESLLSSRASFGFAALLVTWVAVALLVLVVANLHIRLRRLEQGAPEGQKAAPYGHLLGRDVEEVVGAAAAGTRPRVVLFVSSSCGSCARLLAELTSPSWEVPTALVWTDAPRPPERVPAGAVVVADGPRVSAEAGVRVTPFGLLVDEAGRVVQAGPVTSLQVLRASRHLHGSVETRAEVSRDSGGPR